MDPTQFKDPEAYDFKAFTKIGAGKVYTKGEVMVGKAVSQFYIQPNRDESHTGN